MNAIWRTEGRGGGVAPRVHVKGDVEEMTRVANCKNTYITFYIGILFFAIQSNENVIKQERSIDVLQPRRKY